MVILRAFSSGALSISSYVMDLDHPFSLSTLVMACVSVVLPYKSTGRQKRESVPHTTIRDITKLYWIVLTWSTWPIVPIFTWGLLRTYASAAKLRRKSVLWRCATRRLTVSTEDYKRERERERNAPCVSQARRTWEHECTWCIKEKVAPSSFWVFAIKIGSNDAIRLLVTLNDYYRQV
jgi:hypothetical protein